MRKRNIAFAALFLFMAMVFAAPLAEAVLMPAATSSHQHSATHEGCPMPASPAGQAPLGGHSGFLSCCGIFVVKFGVDNNLLGIFFTSTLMIISYTLFIPSRITAELFRPPKR